MKMISNIQSISLKDSTRGTIANETTLLYLPNDIEVNNYSSSCGLQN